MRRMTKTNYAYHTFEWLLKEAKKTDASLNRRCLRRVSRSGRDEYIIVEVRPKDE